MICLHSCKHIWIDWKLAEYTPRHRRAHSPCILWSLDMSILWQVTRRLRFQLLQINKIWIRLNSVQILIDLACWIVYPICHRRRHQQKDTSETKCHNSHPEKLLQTFDRATTYKSIKLLNEYLSLTFLSHLERPSKKIHAQNKKAE